MKAALIFAQSDYSLTAEVHDTFGNLPFTAADAKHAYQLAKGFGIKEENIHVITDMPLPEINKLMTSLKKTVRECSSRGKRSFCFCYAAGHGVADQ